MPARTQTPRWFFDENRVRFEVIADPGSDALLRRRLRWLGSVSTGEHSLSERAKHDIRTGMTPS